MTLKFASKMKDMVPPYSLKRMLHENLEYTEAGHETNPIHSSDLTNQDKEFCPREFILMDILGRAKKSKFVPTSLSYTFKLGRMIETGMRDWFGSSLHGFWECGTCGHKTGFVPRPVVCGVCKKDNWRYVEPVVSVPKYNIVGGVDLLVLPPEQNKLVLVECKSMDKDYFKNLKAPMAEHRLRTNLYLRLVEESDQLWTKQVDTAKGSVLYAMKGYGMKDDTLYMTGYKGAPMSPFKEYIIKRDDAATTPLLEKAEKVAEFRRGTGPIVSGVCSTALCSRAKKCSVVKECFSGKYKAGTGVGLCASLD